jgi:hypothetical protein
VWGGADLCERETIAFSWDNEFQQTRAVGEQRRFASLLHEELRGREPAMAEERDVHRGEPTELSLDDLDQVVGGTGTTSSTAANDEHTFLTGLQHSIDTATTAATTTAAAAVASAQTYAQTHGLMNEQVLIDLGQTLAHDTHAGATATVASIDKSISQEVHTGTFATAVTSALVHQQVSAATAESLISAATGIAGVSNDQMLGAIAHAANAGGASQTNPTVMQFDADLHSRVVGGQAAAGVLGDIEAGRLNDRDAVTAFMQEAHEAGVAVGTAAASLAQTALHDVNLASGDRTGVITDLATAIDQSLAPGSAATVAGEIASTLAPAFVAGTMDASTTRVLVDFVAHAAGVSNAVVATDLIADALPGLAGRVVTGLETQTAAFNALNTIGAIAGLTPAQSEAGWLSAEVNQVQTYGANGTLTPDQALSTLTGILNGAAGTFSQSDAASFGAVIETLAASTPSGGADAIHLWNTLVANPAITAAEQSGLASTMQPALAAGIGTEIAAGTATVSQALSAYAQITGQTGTHTVASSVLGFELLNEASTFTAATTAQLASLATSLLPTIAPAANWPGLSEANAATAVASYVEGQVSSGSVSATAAVAFAEALAGHAHTSIDGTLVSLSSGAGPAVQAAVAAEIVSRFESGAAATDLAAALHAGASAAQVVSWMSAELGIVAAANPGWNQAVAIASTALTLYNAVESALGTSTVWGQIGLTISSFFTGYHAAQDAATDEHNMASAIYRIPGLDAALVHLSADPHLGTAAATLIGERLADGSAAAALVAAMAAGKISAADAAGTLVAEAQAAGYWAAGETFAQQLADATTFVSGHSEAAAAALCGVLAGGGGSEAVAFAQAFAVQLATTHHSAAGASATEDAALGAVAGYARTGVLSTAAQLALDTQIMGYVIGQTGTLPSPAATGTNVGNYYQALGQHFGDGLTISTIADSVSSGLLSAQGAVSLLQCVAPHVSSTFANSTDFRTDMMQLYNQVYQAASPATIDLGTALGQLFVSGGLYTAAGDPNAVLNFAAGAYYAGTLSQPAAAALDEAVAARYYALKVASGAMSVSAAEGSLEEHVYDTHLRSGTTVSADVYDISVSASYLVYVSTTYHLQGYSIDRDIAAADLDLYRDLGALNQTSAQYSLAGMVGLGLEVAIGAEVGTFGAGTLKTDLTAYQAIASDMLAQQDFEGHLTAYMTMPGYNYAQVTTGNSVTDWVHTVLTMAHPDKNDVSNALLWSDTMLDNAQAAFEAGFNSVSSNAFAPPTQTVAAAGTIATPAFAHDSAAGANMNAVENQDIGRAVNTVVGKLMQLGGDSGFGELTQSASIAHALGNLLGDGSLAQYLGQGTATSIAGAFDEYAAVVNSIGSLIYGGVTATVDALGTVGSSLSTDWADIVQINQATSAGALITDLNKFGSDFAAGAEAFGDAFVAGWDAEMQAMATDLVTTLEEAETDPSAMYRNSMMKLGSVITNLIAGSGGG